VVLFPVFSVLYFYVSTFGSIVISISVSISVSVRALVFQGWQKMARAAHVTLLLVQSVAL
jgi:hypothetical protein